MLRDEILIMRKVDNERVVKLYEVYEDEEFVYLVMEYLPDGDLSQLVKNGKGIKEACAKRIMKKLLKTVEYLHGMGVVHRDLKMEHVVMIGDEFKIVDFGLAFQGSGDSFKCGTPGYMAPEIMIAKEYDFKVDIFSLGVILYVLLVGKHPFCGNDFEEVLCRSIQCNYSEKKIKSYLAREMVKCMLNPDPDHRPTTQELLNHPWLNDIQENDGSLITSAFI